LKRKKSLTKETGHVILIIRNKRKEVTNMTKLVRSENMKCIECGNETFEVHENGDIICLKCFTQLEIEPKRKSPEEW
jgi:hypothetical protein